MKKTKFVPNLETILEVSDVTQNQKHDNSNKILQIKILKDKIKQKTTKIQRLQNNTKANTK